MNGGRGGDLGLGFARLFIYSRIDSSRSIGDERPGEVGL